MDKNKKPFSEIPPGQGFKFHPRYKLCYLKLSDGYAAITKDGRIGSKFEKPGFDITVYPIVVDPLIG